MSKVVPEVKSESETVSEVIGHVHVRTHVHVRSHHFTRVSVRVLKKSPVRVRIGHELMSESVSFHAYLYFHWRKSVI